MLFPLLRPHARVVNLSSSLGHLLQIPGELLRKKLSSSSLTEEELTDLLQQFVKLVHYIYNPPGYSIGRHVFFSKNLSGGR